MNMVTKKRTVVNAEPRQIERAMSLVKSGRYRTLSDFVREAVDEKLARDEAFLLADEVERYCADGLADEDTDLISAQLLEPIARRPTRKKPRAAR